MTGTAETSEQLFQDVGCALCHVPTLTTGASEIAVLDRVEFHPYTDLLLHDMGEELDDGVLMGVATGRDSVRKVSIAVLVARSRPRLMSMALAPATTFHTPSANMAWASMVAVLVPSPTRSPVFSAA